MIVLFSAVLFIGSGCSGCRFIDNFLNMLNSGYSVYFYNSEITLEKGEKILIGSEDLIFEDLADGRNAEDISFTLSSSDSSVVNASGRTIRGQSAGSARVTLTTEDGAHAYLNVTVETGIREIELEFPFGRFLPCGSDYAVDVYASLNGGGLSSSGYNIAWYVDGEAISGYSGNPLTLYNDGVSGINEVKAVLFDGGKKYEAVSYAGYYEDGFSAAEKPVVIADKTILSAGSEVRLTLKEQFDYAEWYISGVYAGEGSSIVFTPDKAGFYDIYAECAGNKSNTVMLTVKGGVTPENVSVSYDEAYPLLGVFWETVGNIACTVTAVSGNETVRAVSSEGEAFLALNPDKAYEVTVVPVSENGFYPADSGVITVPALSEQEKYYLGKTYYNGNYYITDDEEFFEFFDYMMYFRRQPVGDKTTTSTERVYMGYDYGEYDDLLGRAFDYSGITGSYNLGGRADGDTATISIEFFTVNTPSVMSSYNRKYHYDALDAMPVHWNPDGEKIEYFSSASKGKVAVSTTDQMFRVAEQGFIPQPEIGSSAANVYEFTEKALDSILSADMTDMEIARAVYEYIMNKNTYDGSVTELDIMQSVKSASFYLEGVLIEGGSYSVCDAMSKAFSFMCNMANVKALRIVGYAGSGAEKGGHAWNKVLIGGKWYIVDCTWGDANVRIRQINGLSYDRVYLESASHKYFLLTDADIEKTHVADSESGPVTSSVPYVYYSHESGEKSGVPSFYIQTQGAALTESLENIARFIAENAGGTRKISAYGINKTSVFYGVEFSVCRRSLNEADKILTRKSKSSFYTTLSRAGFSYNVFRDDDTYYVIVNSGNELYNSIPSDGEAPVRPYWWLNY